MCSFVTDHPAQIGNMYPSAQAKEGIDTVLLAVNRRAEKSACQNVCLEAVSEKKTCTHALTWQSPSYSIRSEAFLASTFSSVLDPLSHVSSSSVKKMGMLRYWVGNIPEENERERNERATG